MFGSVWPADHRALTALRSAWKLRNFKFVQLLLTFFITYLYTFLACAALMVNLVIHLTESSACFPFYPFLHYFQFWPLTAPSRRLRLDGRSWHYNIVGLVIRITYNVKNAHSWSLLITVFSFIFSLFILHFIELDFCLFKMFSLLIVAKIWLTLRISRLSG